MSRSPGEATAWGPGGPQAGEDAGRLRVAVVAPPWFEIPPRGYGGTEAVVHLLVEGLIERGHDVTLLAAGEAGSSAPFVPTFDQPPADLMGAAGESLVEIIHAARTLEVLDGLRPDIVHDHSFAGPLTARSRRAPTLVTAHGPPAGLVGGYYEAIARLVQMVAISESQRRQAPHLPWLGVVHNAIRVEDYRFREDKEDFALFLARLTPEKGPALAIDAAREAG